MNPNRNGGMPTTSPLYGGGNRQPTNPRPAPATTSPTSRPNVQPPTPLTAPNDRAGAVTKPLPTPPSLSPERGLKPL